MHVRKAAGAALHERQRSADDARSPWNASAR